MSSTFWYKGQELHRFDHLYNSTAISERGLEVAVALHELSNHQDGGVLEVGNVLNHYDIPGLDHTVVDLVEDGPRVINADLFDYGQVGHSLIIAISTLEHIGFDYPQENGWGTLEAINHLRSLLLHDGSLIVTIPFGFNPMVGPVLETLDTSYQVCYRRHQPVKGWWDSHWEEVPFREGLKSVYGSETPWASAVWVGEFGPLI